MLAPDLGAMLRCCRLLVASALSVVAVVSAAQPSPWPAVALPRNAQVFDIGQQLDVNGMPMRIRGFLSMAEPAELAQWFRRQLGEPLVENTLAQTRVLGRLQGEHYLTVQLEPAGRGTRGLVAATHLKAGHDNHGASEAATERWLARLPAGSRLLSRVSADDGGRVSRQVLFRNGHDERLNAARLRSLLTEEGYAFEREIESASDLAPPSGAVGGRALYFRSPGREAMATIYRDPSGDTVIVLNTITLVEQFK
jgi:hypothetical protein